MRVIIMRRFFTAVALLFVAAGAVLYAADQGLTLQEARNQALAHSKTLQRLLLSVDSALIDEKINSYNWLPSITASASAAAEVPSASLLDALGVSAGVSVTQQVFDGGGTAIQSAIEDPEVGILVLTEKVAETVPDLVQSLRERGELPLVVEVPDRHGMHRAADFLTAYVRDAIGVNLG